MITSTHNAKVYYVRSLQERATRYRERRFLIEGVRLVEEALRAGTIPTLILYAPEQLEATPRGRALSERLQRLAGIAVSERVLAAAADTVTPQGVVAVVPMPEMTAEVEPVPRSGLSLMLILDGLQDPGNLGTILRSAWAAGLSEVILTPGTVDPYNPKVVRAGMGAHFFLTIRPETPWPQIAGRLAGQPVWLAQPRGGTPYDQVNWQEAGGLIIGSEARGSGPPAGNIATGRVSIPLSRGVESLNAATAASILLFEARRQQKRE